ncbi:MAG: energy-coupling factor transporter ATPase, partial [Clostridiales bacterium]|nr:energy-coupling factor transporter ATPase [Clostridiales bacterium]
MALLETQNLSYRYGVGTPFEVAALDDVNIKIEKGELLAVIGHTGSGKSTLVQHLNGLLKPQQGRIHIDGQDIWQDKHTVKAARFKVGLCFQYPEYQLFESTVYKDIAFGPANMGLAPEQIDERVRTSAEFVGLTGAQLSKSPFDLSGGEKRRAAIAGVMAMQPEILVLDEPTAGLDPRGRDLLMRLICGYRETTSSTVVIV